MKRSLLVLAGATVIVAAGAATAFSVTAPHSAAPGWLHVHTTGRASAHRGRATVTPAVTASGNHIIESRRVIVYRNGRQVASGPTVRLAPGRYQTVTAGTYRTYTAAQQMITHSLLRTAALRTADCAVSAFQPDASGWGTSTAFCTDPGYPGQRQPDYEYGQYTVGDHYRSAVWFAPQTVATHSSVRIRNYSRIQHFTSARRSLTVTRG